MFLTLFTLCSAIKEICVADSENKCPDSSMFISTSEFKASDVEGTPELKSEIKLYLYADISKVPISLSRVDILKVHSNSTETTLKGKITLEFPNNVQDCEVWLYNVELKPQSNDIKANLLALSNVGLIGSNYNILAQNLTTDTRSLLNVNEIQVEYLSLTKLEKVNKNTMINIIPKMHIHNGIRINGDIDFEFRIGDKRFSIMVDDIKIFTVNSMSLTTNVEVNNLKKSLKVTRDEWFSYFELFQYTFILDGGTIIFPHPDEWPQYHETSLQNMNNMQIILESQSEIKIGCQNLPINIDSSNSPLKIVTTSKKCGINGFIQSNKEISIRTDLNEVVQFSVQHISSSELRIINGDNKVELISKYQSDLNFLGNDIKAYFEEFNIGLDAFEVDDLGLTSGGAIAIELSEGSDKIESGNLTVKGQISDATDGRKFKLAVNIDSVQYQYSSHKYFKGLMSNPINLLCSNKEIKQSDWDLDITGVPNRQSSIDYIESIKRAAELIYNKVGNMYCLQLKLKAIPDIVPEKYCIDSGESCFNTHEKINISQLKDHVDKGTKLVEIEIHQDINEPLDLSAIPATAEYSFYNYDDQLQNILNLDISFSSNVEGIKTKNVILKSNFKNIQGDNVRFSIPRFTLINTKLMGEWLGKTIDFTDSYVEIEANNFEELSKSKFKDPNLLLNYSTTSLAIKNDRWVVGTLNRSIDILKSQVSGSFGLIFEAERAPDNAFLIDVDPSIGSIEGLSIVTYSQSSSMNVALKFSDNWNNLQSVGSGIKIRNDCVVKLAGVANKHKISLEGSGDFSISLKDVNTKLNIETPTKILVDARIIIENGDADFSELIFCNGYIHFGFESFRSNGLKLMANPTTQAIIAEKIVVEGSVVYSRSGMLANNEIIMNPKSTLEISYDDQEFGANEVVINYLLDGFPSILVKNITKMPQKIVLNYAGNDVKIESSFVGSAFILIRANNGTFSESQCNKLAQTATFTSQFVDLNGESSVIKLFCSTTFDSNDFSQSLYANITAIPSNENTPSKQEEAKQNVGLIVGCTISAIVVVAVIAFVAVRICRKKKIDQRKSSSD